MTTMAFLYMAIMVSEPILVKSPQPFAGIGHAIKTYLLTPCWDMLRAVLKKREGCLRSLLIIQIVAYGSLWFNFEYSSIEYLYMLKVFDGYSESEYAYYMGASNIALSMFMLIVLPLIKVHPTAYVLMALPGQAMTFYLAPWMKTSWQYYLIQIFSIASYGVWSSARTIFTFCVDEHDIGKIYAAVGIVAACAPLASNPTFRQLYSKVNKV